MPKIKQALLIIAAVFALSAVGRAQMIAIQDTGAYLAPSAPAAGGAVPALVQSTYTPIGSANVVAKSYQSNNTAGNGLMLYTNGGESPGPCSISSVADTGLNTWNVINGSAPTGNLNVFEAVYYVKSAAGGANTVTVTYDATCGATALWLGEYSGLDTSAPLVYSRATTTSNSAAGSGPLLTGAAKLVIGAVSDDGTGAGNTTPLQNFAMRKVETNGDAYWHSAFGDFGTFSSNTITSVLASSFTISGSFHGITIGAALK